MSNGGTVEIFDRCACLKIPTELIEVLVGDPHAGDLGLNIERALKSDGFPKDLKVLRCRWCDDGAEFVICQKDLNPVRRGTQIPYVAAMVSSVDGVVRFDGWRYAT